jgi:prepilin-type N-terminal cleavage/methylation domain-containing protein
MSDKKGFTLIELIVVMVILGILIAVAIPNYTAMVMQGAAKAAQNNLIAIYNAQKNYYYNYGSYCTSAASICNSLASINATLPLNITDNNFNYTCSNTSGFTCTATNISNSNLYLTLTNASIVLQGASGCTTSSGASCNPICSSTSHPTYCPN